MPDDVKEFCGRSINAYADTISDMDKLLEATGKENYGDARRVFNRVKSDVNLITFLADKAPDGPIEHKYPTDEEMNAIKNALDEPHNEDLLYDLIVQVRDKVLRYGINQICVQCAGQRLEGLDLRPMEFE